MTGQDLYQNVRQNVHEMGVRPPWPLWADLTDADRSGWQLMALELTEENSTDDPTE